MALIIIPSPAKAWVPSFSILLLATITRLPAAFNLEVRACL
ncbi:hypothetical protein BAZSYMA_ACONTIG03627_6 [Bathymodiolus azoricus thioautotrophic gill symbiont]|uniref:Uncharacterized protein n=1 Tax=Bathymodiolus azoricus thioautotrophic gill symbiont TaxID=235205 RepID=A0A1H6K6S4_9GAMM|nr:hypothetical protein BAZSYMA_ACONTIG03627_6 [Bathymodiolus azoricus thioautotrophic gill symbiont]